MRARTMLVLLAVFGMTAPAVAGTGAAPNDLPELATGAGHFEVKGGAGREKRAITVHYYRPQTFTVAAPVLMTMPGAGRNGDDYRDAWIEASEKYGVLILSPGYPEKHYPEYWSYNLANMAASVTLDLAIKVDANPQTWKLDDVLESAPEGSGLLHQLTLLQKAGMISSVDVEGTNLTVNTDRRAWLFGDFDRIFDIARRALDLKADTYDLFGHSAGGQILHRLALFHPDSRANRILASNSGWYTLPDFDIAFPYGLKETGLTEGELAAAFEIRLVVFLGEEDDAGETRGSVRHTPAANAQGLHRLARGRNFFQSAKVAADKLDADFNWTLEIVPGIGHDYRRMSAAAADYLYGKED
ncbi:MAG TPA: hypothetical protein VF267_07050 [Gammaproteobacteria bacterium]